ncbi:type II secretion system protein GspL [Sphingomonas sp.]|uniref:type II secretion system protein GspL n=1 Tax=Sphingomonas sp. TaxID=28214 RepID=UPI001D6F987B|nr:type II secretion system protein GspL [Sphingomonas sp.]MBX9796315.1 general secretion pathway protein GspL [Sphingomonas sp.]
MTRVVFLPGDDADGARWLRLAGGSVAARGDGLGAGEEPVVAIAPAADVALHWATLPARSPAQAQAAARVVLADQLLSTPAETQVAVGAAPAGEERPIAVVSTGRLRAWLGELAEHGIDPEAIIPAPLLLPVPETGFVLGDLGGERVVRGPRAGFADDPVLTELLTDGATPALLDQAALETALAAAVATPALDLRQGEFSRRRPVVINRAMLRRAGWLVAAVALVMLATQLVQLVRYGWAAGSLERRAAELARTGLAPGEAVEDAPRQLTERLARLRGPGNGFSATAAALFQAMRAVPGSEARALSFDAQGRLTATLVTQSEAQIADIAARLRDAGFVAEPGAVSGSAGRYQGELRMVPR